VLKNGSDAYCSLSLKRSPPNDQKSRCSNQHYRIVAPPRIEAASLKNQCSLIMMSPCRFLEEGSLTQSAPLSASRHSIRSCAYC
jgi:hypothetical protein